MNLCIFRDYCEALIKIGSLLNTEVVLSFVSGKQYRMILINANNDWE